MPSTAPSGETPPSAAPSLAVSKLSAWLCLPREDINFEWTAYLAPLVLCLLGTWAFVLLRKVKHGITAPTWMDPNQDWSERKFAWVSYGLALLPLLCLAMEAGLNQSRHTVNLLWAFPLAAMCLIVALYVLAKVFPQHFFLGIFAAMLCFGFGFAFFNVGLKCPEEDKDEDACFLVANDEAIWTSGFFLLLSYAQFFCTLIFVVAVAAKIFCHFEYFETVRNDRTGNYYTYEAIRGPGREFYLVSAVIFTIFIASTGFFSLSSLFDETDDGERACLSGFGLGAIIMAGCCTIMAAGLVLVGTYLLLNQENDQNMQHAMDEVSEEGDIDMTELEKETETTTAA